MSIASRSNFSRVLFKLQLPRDTPTGGHFVNICRQLIRFGARHRKLDRNVRAKVSAEIDRDNPRILTEIHRQNRRIKRFVHTYIHTGRNKKCQIKSRTATDATLHRRTLPVTTNHGNRRKLANQSNACVRTYIAFSRECVYVYIIGAVVF